MKPSPRVLLIVVAIVIGMGLVATYRQHKRPSEVAAKSGALEAVYAELPIYPDFQAAAANTFSKDLMASLGKPYNSAARYQEVRTFYVDRLTATGWQLTQERNHHYLWRGPAERELIFRKADHAVLIKYREEKTNVPDWDYAIELYEPVLGLNIAP
jgi:hypothetical protein